MFFDLQIVDKFILKTTCASEEMYAWKRIKKFCDESLKMSSKCNHEFDVFNHGEVECRICKKKYPLSWAVDKIKSDNESIDKTVNTGPGAL